MITSKAGALKKVEDIPDGATEKKRRKSGRSSAYSMPFILGGMKKEKQVC